MSEESLYPKIENGFVYLMEGSKRLGGIDPRELETDTTTIFDAYRMITQKYNLTSSNIRQIINIALTQGKIIDFPRTILSFCYWCWYIDEKNGKGVQNLIDSLKRRNSYEEILSDFFVGEIASKYVESHTVEIKVKKKEIGTDLLINGLKCECKTRLGYLHKNNKDFIFSDVNEVKSLNKLAENEIRKIIKNRVMEAFLKQNADIVFVDTKRTMVGFFQMAGKTFNITKPRGDPPKLRKYMMIFYTKENGKDLWTPIWVSPNEFEQLKSKILKTKAPPSN